MYQFIVVLVLIAHLGIAQENKELSLSYPKLEKFPVFSMDYFYYPNSDLEIDSGKGEFKMNEFRAAVQLVHPLKKNKIFLYHKMQYTFLNYETRFDVSRLNSEKEFHNFEYTLGIIHLLQKRWKLIANVSPMLSSDFEESLSSNDFLIQSTFLAQKRSSPNFEYGFGLTYTTKFGEPALLPVLKMTYKKGNWLTSVSLPSYIAQYYNFNHKTNIGLKASVHGNTFNATFDDDFSEAAINRVIYSNINVGPEFQINLFNDLYLNISSGYTLRNVLEIQDHDLNTIGDYDIEDKFFITARIKILK